MLKWRPEGSDARHCGLMERSEGELERQQMPGEGEGEGGQRGGKMRAADSDEAQGERARERDGRWPCSHRAEAPLEGRPLCLREAGPGCWRTNNET